MGFPQCFHIGCSLSTAVLPGPKVKYKTFFMLNSTEHEIYSAHNVKMPMIVGILTLISRINTTDERFKQRYSLHDKSFHLSQKESINTQVLKKKTTIQSVW